MRAISVEFGKREASQLSTLPDADSVLASLVGTRFEPSGIENAKALRKILAVLADKGDVFTVFAHFEAWVLEHSSKLEIVAQDQAKYTLVTVAQSLAATPSLAAVNPLSLALWNTPAPE